MSKKTAASKPRGKRRASMKALEKHFVSPHDPVRALGEWIDRLGKKEAQKASQTEAKKEEPPTGSDCRIIMMVAKGTPQQLSELMEKMAEKAKLLL